MTGLSLTNEIIALAAGVVTTFIIPWVDKSLHLDIPDSPQTATEIEAVVEDIIKKHEAAIKAPLSDLGTNPFTTAPKPTPPTNETPPSENGAK